MTDSVIYLSEYIRNKHLDTEPKTYFCCTLICSGLRASKIGFRCAVSEIKIKKKRRFFCLFVSCIERKDYSLCLKTLRGRKSIIYFLGNHFSLFFCFFVGGRQLLCSNLRLTSSWKRLIWSGMWCLVFRTFIKLAKLFSSYNNYKTLCIQTSL